MSLCMKEMTPMPDARRPFRNQERKAWREGEEAASAQILSPKSSAQTVKPPHPTPNSHPVLRAPHFTLSSPNPLVSPSLNPLPKLCNAEDSRQSAESAGKSRTKTAEPKSEDRKTPRGHRGQHHGLPALLLLSQTSGTKLFPTPTSPLHLDAPASPILT